MCQTLEFALNFGNAQKVLILNLLESYMDMHLAWDLVGIMLHAIVFGNVDSLHRHLRLKAFLGIDG